MNKPLLLFSLLFLNAVILPAQSRPIPDVDLLKLDSVTIVKSGNIITPGKVTVLVIWNSMMRPARAELDSLVLYFPAWEKKYDVELVTVASEYAPKMVANLRLFLSKRNYTFPVYQECDKKFAAALARGGYALPATYFIDKKGMIVEQLIGYSPGDHLKIEALIATLSKQ